METILNIWDLNLENKENKENKGSISKIFNIQDAALFQGPYLNINKCVILTMLTDLYKRLDFPHADS